VPISIHHSVHRVSVIVALALMCVPTIGLAQESSAALHTLTPLFDATTAPSLLATDSMVSIVEPRETERPSMDLAIRTSQPKLGVMLPLYSSFAVLQALDVHSTMSALQNGGTERNPLLRDLAGRPAGLLALKAGVTASTIFLTGKLRKKHPVGAVVLMAALDSFYATVVVHNYRATR
jgi:hypothetical protein